MADFGNLAGVVKSFTEPLDQNGNPKTFVLWAREVTNGSAAVTLLRFDFTLSEWVPLAPSTSVFKATIAVKTNVSSLTGVSILDSRSLQNNDKVLLVNQADQKQNGLYTFTTTGNALIRTSDFTSSIPGNHLIYVLNGSSQGSLFGSSNIGNVDFLRVDTDNINYIQLTGGNGNTVGVTGTTNNNNWIIINTSDPLATTSNYMTRVASIFNSLPSFTVDIGIEIIIKHTYTTSAIETGGVTVNRVGYFKVNKPINQVEFGDTNPPITIGNLIQITSDYLADRTLHPDEISIDGMGGYDLGNSLLSLSESSGLFQHDFNKRLALGIRNIYEGVKIAKFGQLDVKKIEGNLDDSTLETGDRVINSNLNSDIFLIYGDWVSGNPLDLSSYDPNTSSFYDPNEV